MEALAHVVSTSFHVQTRNTDLFFFRQLLLSLCPLLSGRAFAALHGRDSKLPEPPPGGKFKHPLSSELELCLGREKDALGPAEEEELTSGTICQLWSNIIVHTYTYLDEKTRSLNYYH